MRSGSDNYAWFRPTTLDAALDWLDGRRARIAAGCTDLFPATGAQCLAGPTLDITGITGLRGIEKTQSHWRFGAATTWSDIVRADLPPAFAGLQAAGREVGSIQIQNAATIAGNLCNASPAADGVPCLLTLDARVELSARGGKRRVLPLAGFIKGPRNTDLQPNEIMTAVLVPNEAATGHGAFLKLGARKYLVISIAMVAARLCVDDDGRISSAAVSVGACGPVATRLARLEERLTGVSIETGMGEMTSPDLIAPDLSPIGDVRADAAYRLTAACELVERCLSGLVKSVMEDRRDHA